MAELTIALSKGRLQPETLALLDRAGIAPFKGDLDSRRLRVDDPKGRYSYILLKPADVPVYVEHGIADAGICGRDVLLESGADVYEPLDLRFGRCRLVVAGVAGAAGRGYNPSATAVVGTKFPRLTADYFQRRGVPVELIVLSGSVEIAPVLGLCEHIVDLVDTGRTLRENNLVEIDTIIESSARLVVNRASYHLRREAVARILEALKAAVVSDSPRPA